MTKAVMWEGLTVEQLRAIEPFDPPMKLVVDYEALYQQLLKTGWMLIRTDPSLDRPVGGGQKSHVAPLVKAFNCHVRVVLKQRLFMRRVALDAWYIELGLNKEEN